MKYFNKVVTLKCVLVLLSFVLCFSSQDAFAKEKRVPIYDESGNGKELIDKAVERAADENMNVLVQFGGNWCGWCWKLNDTLEGDKVLKQLLLESFIVVHIDSNTNEKMMKGYAPEITGFPHLTVLDSKGLVVTNQKTEFFEKDGGHDPAKLKTWLEKMAPKPLSAEDSLKHALTRASKGDKKVFLKFGSSGCGWCRVLDTFLFKEDIKELIEKDFVLCRLGLDRHEGADTVFKKYNPQPGGIPWFVILDKSGKAIISADGPSGNIGYPVADKEIAHFIKMIEKSAKNMTAEDIGIIKKGLEKEAEIIKNRMKQN